MVKFDTINTYYYIVIGVVLIALLILYYVERAYVNFQWRAIRDDNMLAGAVGINVIGYKMINFTIAAFMAGISGALFASFQHNLSADGTSRFAVTTSIYLLVYMVVGGQNSFVGPLLGTAVLTLLAERTRSMQSYQPMLIGGIAIVVMLFMPMGLAGLPEQIRDSDDSRRGGASRTVSRLPTSRTRGDADGPARDQRTESQLRWSGRREPRRHDGGRGRDRRPHRPQRRGQEHDAQPHRRDPEGIRGFHRVPGRTSPGIRLTAGRNWA